MRWIPSRSHRAYRTRKANLAYDSVTFNWVKHSYGADSFDLWRPRKVCDQEIPDWVTVLQESIRALEVASVNERREDACVLCQSEQVHARHADDRTTAGGVLPLHYWRTSCYWDAPRWDEEEACLQARVREHQAKPDPLLDFNLIWCVSLKMNTSL